MNTSIRAKFPITFHVNGDEVDHAKAPAMSTADADAIFAEVYADNPGALIVARDVEGNVVARDGEGWGWSMRAGSLRFATAAEDGRVVALYQTPSGGNVRRWVDLDSRFARREVNRQAAALDIDQVNLDNGLCQLAAGIVSKLNDQATGGDERGAFLAFDALAPLTAAQGVAVARANAEGVNRMVEASGYF